MNRINKIFNGLQIFIVLVIIFFCQILTFSQQWQPNVVKYNESGKLQYNIDSEGNKIPDFSYAGYKNGEAGIPTIAVVKTIEALQGDNTNHIQNAIAEISSLPLDKNGFRGALLLKKGIYRVNGTIKINSSGIVLIGEGDGSDSLSNTIIYGVGNVPDKRTIIVAGGGSSTKWADKVSGTQTTITSQKIYVGDKKFTVANPSLYKPGDNIIIHHPVTQAWLNAIDGGGAAPDPDWNTSDAINIIYNRNIQKIIGDTIFIDAPVFNTLDLSLSQSFIYKYSKSGLKTNIGIENLRVKIEALGLPTNSNGDENHAWQAIELKQIEDAWVKNCTMTGFGQSGIMTSTATRITIDGCKALDPISIITGERRYNFNMYHASQLILVKNSYTKYGRHDFVSNGTSTVSGCVFFNNISEYTYSSSEGHRWWSQGLLYDNIKFKSPNSSYVLALYNRGDYGTSHGWAAVNSVAWNCSTSSTKNIYIQKPPIGQNYSIGCVAGKVTGKKSDGAPFDQPEGYIEGTNQLGLIPNSLYEAQLEERLNYTSARGKFDDNEYLPSESKLFDNYPNPFNPSTVIKYSIANNKFTDYGLLKVKLRVFNMIGEEISTLVNDYKLPGVHEVVFNGAGFASGIYLCVLEIVSPASNKSVIQTKKIVMVK